MMSEVTSTIRRVRDGEPHCLLGGEGSTPAEHARKPVIEEICLGSECQKQRQSRSILVTVKTAKSQAAECG